MADVPWDQDVTTDDTTPVDEWNAFKDRLISIAGDKSIGDGFLLVKQGTTADRPSAGYDGRLYYSTDEGIWYRDNGSSWVELVRAEGQIRLNSLAEKEYSSLDNVPSTFPPEAHSIGGAEHNSDTLASLNGLIDDATLDDMENTRPPESHNIAGSAHGTATIRDFNAMIDDGNFDDDGNTRPPEEHGKRDHSDIDQALTTKDDVTFNSVTASGLLSVTDIGFTVSDTSIFDFDNDGTVGVKVRGNDQIIIETYASMLGQSTQMMSFEQGSGNISHQALSLSSKKITDLADPVNAQDAATMSWVEGKEPEWKNEPYATAINFGTVSDSYYVDIPYDDSICSKEFSVTVRFRTEMSGISDTHSLFCSSTNFGVHLYEDGSGNLLLNCGYQDEMGDFATLEQQVERGKWITATFLYDGKDDELRLYIDGELKTTYSWSGDPALDSDNRVIGYGPQPIRDSSDYQPYGGDVEFAAFHDGVLSASEISEINKKGIEGIPDTNLQGLWKLNEGAGGTAYDASSNANDGSLVGPPEWIGTVSDAEYSTTTISDVESAGLAMQANINPDKDANRQLGEGTAGSDDADIRWSEIHAVDIYGTVHNNDLAFTEKRCEVCGEEFQEGDRVSLIVNEVREDGTYMVPKHEAC